MKELELREYQLEFEKIKESINSEFKEINHLRKKFVKDYSVKHILSLNIDEYIVGKSDTTSFCNRIENELNNWGNIHGSTAKKFGIYYGTLGADNKRKYRIGKSYFGTQSQKAFGNIISSIIELIENNDNLDIIKKNPISPMFKGKILSVYFPNRFLNIFSAKHLNYFINMLSLENTSKSELDKQNLLLEFKNTDLVMQYWTIYEFSKFLYFSFGSPNNEIKDENISPELKDFKLNDFPPIEGVNSEFVDLMTEKLPKQKNKSKSNKSRKIDFSKQSKKNKRIGDRGEQIVLISERKYLKDNGKIDLAKKVEQISKKNDIAGYDILSYDLNGKKKFIEVKSTLRPVGYSNIYISENEIATSKENKNHYFYIVYNVGNKKPLIWKINGVDFLNDKNIKIEPIMYRIDLKTK